MQKIMTSSLVLLLCGCSLTLDYNRPTVASPAGWSTPAGETSQSIPQEWWRAFNNAELDNVMAEALAQNLDLKAGLYRIEQSRAALKIAGASELPAVGASAGASRSRTDSPDSSADYRSSLSGGLAVSYELDLFGANAATVSASRAALAGTQYSQESLRLVTLGDTAQTYFAILNNRERLRLNQESLDNVKEVLRIIEARYEAGAVSALELSQQKSALATAEAARAALEQQESVARNSLAVLLGKAPQGFNVNHRSLTDLTIPSINPGQPSQLLERRPDIRAAEAALIAANANIGVARAAFFPSVMLGLNGNWSTLAFGDPLTSAISLASSLSAPIFQGGRLEGGLEQATARQKELVETYRKTVLTAFQEVEDAMVAVDTAQTREARLQEAMDEARTAYTLSQNLYEAGATDFQTLLNAQSTYLSAQDNFAQARLARLSAAIDLFKALGGGWQASSNATQS